MLELDEVGGPPTPEVLLVPAFRGHGQCAAGSSRAGLVHQISRDGLHISKSIYERRV